VSEQEQKGLGDEFEVKGRADEETPDVEGHMFKGRGEDPEQEADECGFKGRSEDAEQKG